MVEEEVDPGKGLEGLLTVSALSADIRCHMLGVHHAFLSNVQSVEQT